jgi:DNA-binding MarR family transcriptional regulator
MRKSNRLVNQFYESRLSELNLKSGQFSILRAIHFMQPTTNTALQGVLVIDQTTLTRNFKPLLRDGYLKLSIDPDDARVKLISHTAEGKALYESAVPIWQKAQEDIVEKLGETEAKNILTLSDSLVKALASN